MAKQKSKKDLLLGRSVPIADFLTLEKNDDVLKMLQKYGDHKPDQEKIMFSSKVTKINKNSKEQERIMLITTKAVYNLKENDFKKPLRRVAINKIVAVTISTKSDELVFHIPDEYDYRYKSNKKERISNILNQFYEEQTNKKLTVTKLDMESLACVSVTKEVSNYQTKEQKELRKKQLQFGLEEAEEEKVVPNDFEPVKSEKSYRGQYDKVIPVIKKNTKKKYFMKMVKKTDISQYNAVNIERKILKSLQHSFLFSLQYAIQTEQKMYFIMEYPTGGSLKTHLAKKKTFTEKEAKFIIAECVEAIGHLHFLDFIYRDIRPENVLLTYEGHVKLADYGSSKDTNYTKNEKKENVNDEFDELKKQLNPEYIAPEILKKINYTKDMDWWSIGILFYHLVVGQTPFVASSPGEIFKRILKDDIEFPKIDFDDEIEEEDGKEKEIDNGISDKLEAFIKKLLKKDVPERLGSGPNDVDYLRKCAYFEDMDWVKLDKKEIEPIFVPSVVEN